MGLSATVERARTTRAGRIQMAFVCGSVARSQLKPGSDIDLFVVGPISFGEALTEAQSRLARDVNPTVYDLADFQRRLAKKEHFVSAVMEQPKLFVIGSEHELDQLARRRLARRA